MEAETHTEQPNTEELFLADGHKVTFIDSHHVGMHSEVVDLLPNVLKKIDPSKLSQYGSINIPLESDQSAGKANIAKIPRDDQGNIREGVQIVYAPRLDAKNQPLTKKDGTIVYSQWVKGLSPEDIPNTTHIRVSFKMKDGVPDTEGETYKIVTAYVNPGVNSPPEYTGPTGNDALDKLSHDFWRGEEAYAFVYDESKMDLSKMVVLDIYDPHNNI